MPKKNSISSIPAADLAYAVGQLVTAGKTTAAEVLQLAADRGQRIAALQAELNALRQGEGVAAPAAQAGRPQAGCCRQGDPDHGLRRERRGCYEIRRFRQTYSTPPVLLYVTSS